MGAYAIPCERLPADASASAPPETTHLQVIFTLHDGAGQMYRQGVPTLDRAACDQRALDLMARHDVKEVFLCTVHAAYSKETTIKKVI